MLNIINMHQIQTNTPKHCLLTTLLLLVTLLDPVWPQIVIPEFSQAYASLISSAKTHPHWWTTCLDNFHTHQQTCLQYMAAMPEENITQSQGVGKAFEEGGEAKEKQWEEGVEAGWIEVIWVLFQESWEVAVQGWREWVGQMLREDQGRPVEYDDNYASLNGGAIILRKSSHRIHNALAILEDSLQKYLYSDQQLPIEVVIALKEEVKIESISIRSNEVYSSIVRDFMLEGALDLQEQGEDGQAKSCWFKLLSTSAKNNGAEQHFRIKNKVVRFLRLKIISKYGDWKYFTMTQIKVYGEGLFAEALIDYQTVQSSDPPVRSGDLQLATDLGVAYQQLMSFGGEKKPQENVLTFLLEKVGTLSKIHEFQLFYMQNLSLRLENASRLEKEFRQHKNLYNAKNTLYQKYRQQRQLEQKLAELENNFNRTLKNHTHYLQQLKFAQISSPQVCPNKEEEIKNTLILYIAATIAVNIILSAMVAYCCFRYFKNKEKQINKQEL